MATADPGYENRLTTVPADYGGVASPDLPLTVLNVDDDNYRGYGGDGIEDSWQIGDYGAPPNAEAAPRFDMDFDGDDNTRAFLFATSPLDAASFFQLTVLGFSAPETADVVGNIFIPGRMYTLMAANDLDTYIPVGIPFTVSSIETDLPLQDTVATEDVEFFVMSVERPLRLDRVLWIQKTTA